MPIAQYSYLLDSFNPIYPLKIKATIPGVKTLSQMNVRARAFSGGCGSYCKHPKEGPQR